MSRALAGAALWIPDYLAKWRVPFEVVPGWETRGKAGGRFARLVNHHIGIGGTAPAPGLRTVTHGRAGLRNSLCNVHTDRPGSRVRVVAAGVAWHAGAGSWLGLAGNEAALGNECEGTTGQAAAPRQLELVELTSAALLDGLHQEEGAVCQHYEWADGRKVDMWAIRDPHAFRANVGRLLHPIPLEEDDDMARTCIPSWATRNPKTSRAELYRLADDGNGTPLVLALNGAPIKVPGIRGAKAGSVFGIPFVTLPGLTARAIGVHEIESTGAIVVVCEDGGEIDVAARPKAA